jgi:hypothetical protein
MIGIDKQVLKENELKMLWSFMCSSQTSSLEEPFFCWTPENLRTRFYCFCLTVWHKLVDLEVDYYFFLEKMSKGMGEDLGGSVI